MNRLAERTYVAFEVAGALPTALALLAAAALLVLAWRAAAGPARGRRAVLFALRATLGLGVVALALRPVLRTETLSLRAAPVAVVVDASGSMGVRDQVAHGRRLEAVAAWARREAEPLAELESEMIVDWFAAADGEVRAVTRAEVARGGVVAAGSTDLAGSLARLAERYPGGRRPAVLLVSDGADHGLLRAARARGDDLAGLVGDGGPVASLVPDAGGLADLAVEVLAHDPIGFLRTDITIRARIRATGLDEAEVPVSLLAGDQLVTVRPVRVGGAAGPTAEVTFTLQPDRVGETLYRLQVPAVAGEAVTTNNEAVLAVRVVRDRIRVLQVTGRPSWDGRFLRELLKRDPAIDLVSFFILRQAWDDTNADTDELSLIPFPVSELFGDKITGFDLVIFQNLDLEPYPITPHLARLRDHVVEGGAAVVVVGGDLAFGRDYAAPELAEILPADRAARVEWRGGDFRLAATDIGLRHPILRLGLADGDVESAVAELLPVRGLDVGLEPRPDALVLLETADAERRPVVVAGAAGAGRALVVASDGTWRWSLPMAGAGRSPRGYERFWENAIRWLLRDPRASLVTLEADRREIGPGESLELRVHVRTEAWQPDADVPVTLRVRDAGSGEVEEHRLTTGEDGIARWLFEPEQAGLHAFTATTPRGDAGPLHVERVDPGGELADPSVDVDLLQALADATGGGKVRRLAESGLDVPFAVERDVRVDAVRSVPLWRTWWAWGLVVGLACAEWWLRRRWGLP